MNLGRKHYWLAGAAMALCMPATAMGQTTRSDEIVVVGRTIEETLPQELKKYGSDVEEITSAELRNQSFVDVSSALQMKTPGLFLAPRGGPFSYLDISLQGSRTQDILFLVDGVRINNRLYNTTVTDTLPASMVERIEVLKGGQSLFYGTQAAAGVINVVTRGYTDAFNGLITARSDTNDSWGADGYIRGKMGPGNFVLYASKDKSDGFQQYDVVQPSATDRDRGYDVSTIGAKYRINFTDQLSLDARYQYTDATLDYLQPRLTAFGENSREENLGSLALAYAPMESLEFQVKGYWYKWDSHYTDIFNVVGSPGATVVDSDNLFWGFEDKGVNALAKFMPGGPLEYLVGYDYQQYSGKDEVLLIAEKEETVHAFYGQLRTTDSFLENGAFAAGVRYNETGGANATVWNVSGHYNFTPYFYAEGLVGTSFLLPTAEQLYALDPCCAVGNSNIEPEESKNLNLSIGGTLDGEGVLQWQLTYFARDIDNLISDGSFADAGINPAIAYPTLDPADYGNGVYFNQEGTVETRGFEASAAARLGEAWTFQASYTHANAEVEGTSTQIARIPKDFVKAGANYVTPSGRWGADANVLWVGEQNSQSITGFGVVEYGDYTVVDLAAHYFIDEGLKHKITARLENAFDEEYATRVNSALRDTGGRFLFANRGVPQTFHLSYAYQF
jgi:outer membrane cobalamin receptor